MEKGLARQLHPAPANWGFFRTHQSTNGCWRTLKDMWAPPPHPIPLVITQGNSAQAVDSTAVPDCRSPVE